MRKTTWREWIYMPKDGTLVDLIEAGSTGVHQGYYMGTWPKGSVSIVDDFDSWPSHPILYRERPTEALHGSAATASPSPSKEHG